MPLKCDKYKKGKQWKQRPYKCTEIALIVPAAAVSNSRGQTLPDPIAALLAYGSLKGTICVSRAPTAKDMWCIVLLDCKFFSKLFDKFVFISTGVSEFYFQKIGPVFLLAFNNQRLIQPRDVGRSGCKMPRLIVVELGKNPKLARKDHKSSEKWKR